MKAENLRLRDYYQLYCAHEADATQSSRVLKKRGEFSLEKVTFPKMSMIPLTMSKFENAVSVLINYTNLF